MKFRFLTCSILVLSTLNLSRAQDQEQALDLSLSGQLNLIMDKAETYENYKVIRSNDLVNFKSSMIDSLIEYKMEISTLETDMLTLRKDFELLKSEFEETQLKLQVSEEQNASIPFLWFTVNKSAYNIVLWSLIALLILSLGILYYRIKHVCAVVKRVKSAYSKIMDEYRAQRHQAVENK